MLWSGLGLGFGFGSCFWDECLAVFSVVNIVVFRNRCVDFVRNIYCEVRNRCFVFCP